MAKKPAPTQSDPATLAFSAVEDALKDSVFGSDENTPPPAAKSTRDTGSSRNEQARARDKIASQAGTVANDDLFASSKILYGLNTRSSGTPTTIAAIVSAAWFLGVALLALVR